MSFIDVLRTAIFALRGNWMRSALTSLGVIIGIATLSVAFIRGSRWKPWNTNPILSRRSAASASASSVATSTPSHS